MSNSPYSGDFARGSESAATLVSTSQPKKPAHADSASTASTTTLAVSGNDSPSSSSKKKEKKRSNDPNALSDSKFKSQARRHGWSSTIPSGASFGGM